MPLATQNDGFIQISQELLGRLDPRPTTTVTYNVTYAADASRDELSAGAWPARSCSTRALTGPLNGAGNVDSNDADTTAFLRSTLGGGSVTVYKCGRGDREHEPAVGQGRRCDQRLRSLLREQLGRRGLAARAGHGDLQRRRLAERERHRARPRACRSTRSPSKRSPSISATAWRCSTIPNVQPSFIEQDGYGVRPLRRRRYLRGGHRVDLLHQRPQVVPVAEIALVGFYAPKRPAPRRRRRLRGHPRIGRSLDPPSPAAPVLSGGVESSNTDISEEFAKMIVTQQAYTANTRVISTAQEMIREVLNVVR